LQIWRKATKSTRHQDPNGWDQDLILFIEKIPNFEQMGQILRVELIEYARYAQQFFPRSKLTTF